MHVHLYYLLLYININFILMQLIAINHLTALIYIYIHYRNLHDFFLNALLIPDVPIFFTQKSKPEIKVFIL